MDVAALLLDMYGRVPALVDGAVDGLTAEQLVWQPAPEANTIGWLVWHLTRVIDTHLAELDGLPQEWVTGDHADGFGLEPDPDNHGYGHSSAQMLAVRPADAATLHRYFDPVFARTTSYLAELTADQLDEIVDRNWDPPVTLGVRLISVVDDCLEHAGQAGYIRGLMSS